ncbi:MAG: AAA family ATPase [Inhella sp.]
MTHDPTQAPGGAPLQTLLAQAMAQIGRVIKGKPGQVADCLACMIAGGHLLIEDLPGVGKTTLAQALSITLGLRFARTQFTADLLPSDLTGVNVYDRQAGQFVFKPGPVFAQVLLADEINRAGPKTQSALLEAMEERQVTVEGVSHALPQPFFVIATQNPTEQLGTYPLPESQLDRFLMTLRLGYPDRSAERELLLGGDSREQLATLPAVMTPDQLLQAQAAARQVPASPALLDYLQTLLEATRGGHWFVEGLSPRAGLAWLRAARAKALLAGRAHGSPDDVQAVAVPVLAHRLRARAGSGRGSAEQVRAMIDAVPLP